MPIVVLTASSLSQSLVCGTDRYDINMMPPKEQVQRVGGNAIPVLSLDFETRC